MQHIRNLFGLLVVLLCTAAGVRGQSTYTANTQSVVLWNGVAANNDRYLSITAQGAQSANYELLLPTAAPAVGQSLQCSSIAGTDYTMVWAGVVAGSGSPTQVAYWNSTGALTG